MKSTIQQRVFELIDLAAAEGFSLGLPPESIISLEDAGYLVCLRTGAVIGRDTDWFELTTYGEAMAHLLSSDSTVQL